MEIEGVNVLLAQISDKPPQIARGYQMRNNSRSYGYP
jgi:hypothetical protein